MKTLKRNEYIKVYKNYVIENFNYVSSDDEIEFERLSLDIGICREKKTYWYSLLIEENNVIAHMKWNWVIRIMSEKEDLPKFAKRINYFIWDMYFLFQKEFEWYIYDNIQYMYKEYKKDIILSPLPF